MMGTLLVVLFLLFFGGLVVWGVSKGFGRRVELDWSRGRIYGWYGMEILSSRSFNDNDTVENIQKIKELVEKELDDNITKYKKLN